MNVPHNDPVIVTQRPEQIFEETEMNIKVVNAIQVFLFKIEYSTLNNLEVLKILTHQDK